MAALALRRGVVATIVIAAVVATPFVRSVDPFREVRLRSARTVAVAALANAHCTHTGPGLAHKEVRAEARQRHGMLIVERARHASAHLGRVHDAVVAAAIDG